MPENRKDLIVRLVSEIFHNIRAVSIVFLIDSLTGNSRPLRNFTHRKVGFCRVFQCKIQKRFCNFCLCINWQTKFSFLLLR